MWLLKTVASESDASSGELKAPGKAAFSNLFSWASGSIIARSLSVRFSTLETSLTEFSLLYERSKEVYSWIDFCSSCFFASNYLLSNSSLASFRVILSASNRNIYSLVRRLADCSL